MKDTKIPILDIKSLQNNPNVITIGNDFALVDSINTLPMPHRAARIHSCAFSLCLRGEIDVAINMKSLHVCAGDILMLRPNDIIQYLNHSRDFSSLFIGVNYKSTQDIVTQIKQVVPLHYINIKTASPIRLNRTEQQCIIDYYTLLKTRSVSSCNPWKREIVINILRAMIYELLNILERYIPKKRPSKAREDQLFEMFIREVDNSYKEHRDVAFYADKLCLTPKYLSQMVKKATGQTAGQWIDHRVILEAKALLQATDMTVQQISQELNFSNQSFFGKYFKNITHTSPKKYRKD